MRKTIGLLLIASGLFAQSRQSWAQKATPEEETRWQAQKMQEWEASTAKKIEARAQEIRNDMSKQQVVREVEAIQAQERAKEERIRQYWAAQVADKQATDLKMYEGAAAGAQMMQYLAGQREQRNTDRLIRALERRQNVYVQQDPAQMYDLNNQLNYMNQQLYQANQQQYLFSRPQPAAVQLPPALPNFNSIKAAGQR